MTSQEHGTKKELINQVFRRPVASSALGCVAWLATDFLAALVEANWHELGLVAERIARHVVEPHVKNMLSF